MSGLTSDGGVVVGWQNDTGQNDGVVPLVSSEQGPSSSPSLPGRVERSEGRVFAGEQSPNHGLKAVNLGRHNRPPNGAE
ncbi:hypothetical protein Enr13x_30310 [Stieleria neptunia]|uniref:Uncharacterized protein n=1 Tax=Stieleria neptunia TaxID=2527979 RepID=A0A518HQQ2_9BACT|nr:hypothetical protein Enr13x_30310 [Stieleria neptunia]